MARNHRWRRFRTSNRTWQSEWLPVLTGLIGGSFLALLVAALEGSARGIVMFDRGPSAAPWWAFAFGFVALTVPMLLVQMTGRSLAREARALINIRPFTGDRLLGHDVWAMDAVFAEQIITAVDQNPEHVVELGAGHSTVLIAQRLERQGCGHVTAFDHQEEYAGRTRRWLRELGLEHRATVVHAPLTEATVEGREFRWYSIEALIPCLPPRIDLLIVDGPPGLRTADIRWPALPLLRDRLAPGAVILMDDGDRRRERRIAYDWHDRLGGRIRYTPGGKGGWILRAPDA